MSAFRHLFCLTNFKADYCTFIHFNRGSFRLVWLSYALHLQKFLLLCCKKAQEACEVIQTKESTTWGNKTRTILSDIRIYCISNAAWNSKLSISCMNKLLVILRDKPIFFIFNVLFVKHWMLPDICLAAQNSGKLQYFARKSVFLPIK